MFEEIKRPRVFVKNKEENMVKIFRPTPLKIKLQPSKSKEAPDLFMLNETAERVATSDIASKSMLSSMKLRPSKSEEIPDLFVLNQAAETELTLESNNLFKLKTEEEPKKATSVKNISCLDGKLYLYCSTEHDSDESIISWEEDLVNKYKKTSIESGRGSEGSSSYSDEDSECKRLESLHIGECSRKRKINDTFEDDDSIFTFKVEDVVLEVDDVRTETPFGESNFVKNFSKKFKGDVRESVVNHSDGFSVFNF